ncbi:acetyl-CoA carboxylase biotin carboxyl carrier protein subunit [Orrella marina]|uniref:Acetyl-CoA carboxylase biotin carboxyl carrier protein subunit n=1 Tax=Orrella marina TaxID=2163011 RepID=A0A2R4XGM5_9BURK|nr:acetyl-CoA carboxylase biotin carboxyl carrier protein subunit [Orrella marina]AWB32843.1 acetyl-CoA carboxylase biotin carboxyl carrier protein subunit [Orrella marina]
MAQVELMSDVTGSVWKILMEVGTAVDAEEPILLIESMKMEIPLVSEKPGTIVEIMVAEGDPVTEGQIIAKIEV